MTARRAIDLAWLGQAGFRLTTSRETVLVDPFLSQRADRRYAPPAAAGDLLDTTVVLCTHEHDDHLDLAFLGELFAAGARPRVVVPAPVVPLAVAGGLDPAVLVPAAPGAPFRVGDVTVEAVAAVHGHGGDQPVEYGFRYDEDPDGSYRFLGYLVELDGVRVFHSGDTLLYPGYADELKRLAPDVLLIAINGRDYMREDLGCVGNLNEEEAAWLCRQVQPAFVIPMHYDGFANNPGDPGRFATALGDGTRTTLTVPARGRNLRLEP